MTPERIGNIRDLVFPLIEGKRLLDIGCIGHDFEKRQEMGTFYIDEFRRKAAYAKGIDILEDDVARARRQGYEVEVGDAETYLEPSAYDVIFAGELIEHLSSPGAFLKCAHENLRDDGVLVLTTPNAFSFSRLLRCFTTLTNEPPLNEEHTCYFTPLTMQQLVTRWGFRIERVYYSDYDWGPGWKTGWKRRLGLKINSMISDLAPQFSQSFVVVLEKV